MITEISTDDYSTMAIGVRQTFVLSCQDSLHAPSFFLALCDEST
jgi:hypothetical protein